MQKYETIFVIDSLLKSDEIEAIITKYEKFISTNGGQIETIDPWGKKRLAYEINKRQYGYYVLIRFDGPGSIIKQLEREYRLNETILRYMTLRLNKQALKTLAKQQSSAPSTPKATPSETPKIASQDEAVASEDDSSKEPEMTEVSDEVSENTADKDEAESKPEGETKVEAESAAVEEPPPLAAEATEDKTKTE
ncbi:MAG: 30S ribosomal protein S6 [Actinobacteria bacterium]|nr:30S ribosomal protein S6 [Actinomycetota bacterium]